MDFEVGDIVRVKNADKCRRLAEGLSYTTEVFCGGVFEIERKCSNGWLELSIPKFNMVGYGGADISDHRFRPEWLELIGGGLHIGDKVKYVGDEEIVFAPPRGTIGTLVAFDPAGYCYVVWPVGSVPGNLTCCHPKEELAEVRYG